MLFRIRRYRKNDLNKLAEIYQTSIKFLGISYYTQQQVEAWANYFNDSDKFEDWLMESSNFVAVDKADICIGFGGFEMHGRISSLFVSPQAMRKGVGSALLEHILKKAASEGINELTTQTSEFSKPLFEKYGFGVKEIEETVIDGVEFRRYVMQLLQ